MTMDSRQSESPAATIRGVLVEVVGGNLDWNVRAYGTAWTGEREDTEFLVHGATEKVLEALAAAGYVITEAK